MFDYVSIINFCIIIITIIIFLYPRVYNARGLKTERIKTAEMIEVRNVISEATVQKHRIKSLYCNRQALEKEASLSLFSREATQPTSKLSQKLQRRRAERTQILHSDWLEYIIIIIIIIITIMKVK